MKPTIKPKRSAEQRAEEEAIRRQHAADPVRQRPAGAVNQQSFAAILSLLARFKAVRESQGLKLGEVAERMGIDAPALSRLETGKMLNPTLATLHKWAEALGEKLNVDLLSPRLSTSDDLEDKGYGSPVEVKQLGENKIMSILPILNTEDRIMLKRPIEKTEDQGTYVRCDHQGGGISYWRFLRRDNLVKLGDYKPWTWVVVVVDGPDIPREGYPIDEGEVPQVVRDLKDEKARPVS